jgi:hypothetical protein
MLKFGNHKLGNDTAIFNMSTATNCPARSMCSVIKQGIKCYAEKAEIQYPNVVPAARRRQETTWRTTDEHTLLLQFTEQIRRRKITTNYLRFNEAGDFHDQHDVEKLSYIADGLTEMGITTYGYTARADLDFRNAKFLVKGSSHSSGNNGTTIVIDKLDDAPKGYIICPGSCKRCNLCKINVAHNIAFRKH